MSQINEPQQSRLKIVMFVVLPIVGALLAVAGHLFIS